MQKITSLASNAVLAKARAMYGNILTYDDYNELVNCRSINELTSYLKGHTIYSHALSSSGSVSNRARTEAEIRRFSYSRICELASFDNAIGQKINEIINIDFDLYIILNSAYHLDTNIVPDAAAVFPSRLRSITQLNYYELERATGFNEFYKALDGTPYQKPLDVFFEGNAVFSIQLLENALYRYMCGEVRKILKKNYSGDEFLELEKIFKMKSDFKMFESIFRMKKYFTHESVDISKIFYTGYSALTIKEIEALLHSYGTDDFFAKLKTTKYGKMLDEKYKDYIEKCTHMALQKYYEKQLRFSTHAEVVLISYISILENETKNIVHITEGIRYGLSPEEISKYLILGENK